MFYNIKCNIFSKPFLEAYNYRVKTLYKTSFSLIITFNDPSKVCFSNKPLPKLIDI